MISRSVKREAEEGAGDAFKGWLSDTGFENVEIVAYGLELASAM
jgi:hypothetical protein